METVRTSGSREKLDPTANGCDMPETLLAEPAPRRRVSGALTFLLCIALAVLTVAVYAQVRGFSFINYDDGYYVYDNPIIKKGPTLDGIRWAFTTFIDANWHPLAWMLHMVDCSLFGLNAGAHHLVSAGLHLANTLLLFLAFVAMTRQPWRSAFVAGIFAIHPLHVQSVAWIAPTNDLLSTLLALLALHCYIRYARDYSARAYAAMLALFALALMARSMVMTLPFVLLLLDLWPLGRLGRPFDWRQLKPLLAEKLPLFALSGASLYLTYLARKAAGSVMPLSEMPVSSRIATVADGYLTYVVKTFWPTDLGLLYPIHHVPAGKVALAVIMLAAITLACIRLAKTRPFFLVGWLWFLGMLVPVVGILQTGLQATADRYMYLPLVGLSVAVVWLVANAVEDRPFARSATALFACAALALGGWQSYRQAGYYRSSRQIFEHTLAVTRDNALMHNSLGIVLAEEGKLDDAISHFRKALAIEGDYVRAHNNLGIALARTGRADEAVAEQRKAVALDPRSAKGHYDLGSALAKQGKLDEAVAQYRESIGIDPGYMDARIALGRELLKRGECREAAGHLTEALRAAPGSASLHADLGSALLGEGRYSDAAAHFEASLRAKPNRADVHNNLACALRNMGRPDEAISHCAEALRLRGDFADAHYNMGMALAAGGRTWEAASEFSEVLRLQPSHEAARSELGKLQGAVPAGQGK